MFSISELFERMIVIVSKLLRLRFMALTISGLALGLGYYYVAAALFVLSMFLAGKDMLKSWYLVAFGLAIGLVWNNSHGLVLGATGLLAVLCVVLFTLFLWTWHAFTGKTPILEVMVKNVKEEQGQIIYLQVKDIKKKTEKIFSVRGDKWGISANVVLFENWVIFLGGKTFYRLNHVVGMGEERIDKQALDEGSQKLWQEFEKSEAKLPGVRAVYEDMCLKQPMEGRLYTIYVENDGALVPELQEG